MVFMSDFEFQLFQWYEKVYHTVLAYGSLMIWLSANGSQQTRLDNLQRLKISPIYRGQLHLVTSSDLYGKSRRILSDRAVDWNLVGKSNQAGINPRTRSKTELSEIPPDRGITQSGSGRKPVFQKWVGEADKE